MLLKKYKWTWIMLAVCLALAGYLVYSQLSKPKLPIIGAIAPFSLENLDGRTITLEETNGKVRLFYFFFSHCPDVCPVSTMKMSIVQDELKSRGLFGKEAELISITFDPKRDTPERLKEFGDKFKADYSGWYFLRGDQQEVIDLAMNSFKILVNQAKDGNFVHMDLIAMVDRDGNLRELYRPEVTAQEIADGVARLAK